MACFHLPFAPSPLDKPPSPDIAQAFEQAKESLEILKQKLSGASGMEENLRSLQLYHSSLDAIQMEWKIKNAPLRPRLPSTMIDGLSID